MPSGGLSPLQALETLDQRHCRILLKRPENHEPRFRELLDALFKQVLDLCGGLGSEHVVRLETVLLISSGGARQRLSHFDPEIGFFSQIANRKLRERHARDSVSVQGYSWEKNQSLYLDAVTKLLQRTQARPTESKPTQVRATEAKTSRTYGFVAAGRLIRSRWLRFCLEVCGLHLYGSPFPSFT